jgi:hypothetical protein
MMKKAKYFAVTAIAFCFIIGFSTVCWPWCWIRDTGKVDDNCSSGTYQVDCCSGNLQVWLGAAMQYRISYSTSNSLLAYIRAGAARWTDIAMSTFTFTEGARTTEWDYQYDGVNTLNIDSSFCTHYGSYCGMGILGFSGTWTSYYPSYHAVENDVILNGDEFTWGDGTGSTMNTEAVVAHELGHSAGVTHPGSTCRQSGSAGCGPEFPAATMYWNYSGGQPTDKTSLELDDVASLIYGYPRSTLRVRVLNAGGSPVSGATVELIGTAAPVNGSSITQGGSVYGDISAALIGDRASSSTYVNATPFSNTNANGYTNYIYPVAQSFSVRATSGSNTVTQSVTAAAGTSTVTVQFASSGCPPCPSNGVITNATYPAGSTCSCSHGTAITLGENVTVEDSATVTFTAPLVTVLPGFHAEDGSTVTIQTTE